MEIIAVVGFLLGICRWVVDVAGAAGTLYEGETFKLQFKFGSRYPFDSPEVFCVNMQFQRLGFCSGRL